MFELHKSTLAYFLVFELPPSFLVSTFHRCWVSISLLFLPLAQAADQVFEILLASAVDEMVQACEPDSTQRLTPGGYPSSGQTAPPLHITAAPVVDASTQEFETATLVHGARVLSSGTSLTNLEEARTAMLHRHEAIFHGQVTEVEEEKEEDVDVLDNDVESQQYEQVTDMLLARLLQQCVEDFQPYVKSDL
eukprot:m.245736 g.245736  ORF g.245736 m.245736 type:complete len:192 (+) comp15367_c1_seq1:178-753(+)